MYLYIIFIVYIIRCMMWVYLSIYTVCNLYLQIYGHVTCIDHFLSFCPVQVHMDSFACPSSALDAQVFIRVNGLKPVHFIYPVSTRKESSLEQHQQKT